MRRLSYILHQLIHAAHCPFFAEMATCRTPICADLATEPPVIHAELATHSYNILILYTYRHTRVANSAWITSIQQVAKSAHMLLHSELEETRRYDGSETDRTIGNLRLGANA